VAVATSVSFFPQAAGIVTIATGSSLAPGEARKVIARSFRTTLAALSLGCGALLVLCPWLIGLAYGPSYSSAATACKILLPGTVALGLNQVLYDGARALEQPALPSYAEGLSTVITLGLLFLLLPRMGFLGAAIASTVAYTASLIFMLSLARSRMQLGLRDLLGAPRSQNVHVILHTVDAVKMPLAVVDDAPDVAEEVWATVLVEDRHAVLGGKNDVIGDGRVG
jgi:O-antigen/teichoic acid export membrane protein